MWFLFPLYKAYMDDQLLTQLAGWNPWWSRGKGGVDVYRDPEYTREAFEEIAEKFLAGDQIVSIVGMRQVGKSTMMRQIIRRLLEEGVDARRILYVSFDDPFLRTHYGSKNLFENVILSYAEGVLHNDLRTAGEPLYFFFDEVHQLSDWERAMNSYYDRKYPIHYIVTGSSSIHLQQKHRESLLGRIAEYTLWPFSFREFAEFRLLQESATSRKRGISCIRDARRIREAFLKEYSLKNVFSASNDIFREMHPHEKQRFSQYLRMFIVEGGFPRVWQQNDLASKHRMLWEQYVGKTLFEDLLHTTRIRRVKDLEFLFVRLLGFNGSEAKLTDIQRDMKMSYLTLDRYLRLFLQTFLLFRVDKTKSKRMALKRRSGKVKFYVTEPALRNALYKKDESVLDDPEEMSIIAETLVCSAIERWDRIAPGIERVSYYRERNNEVDFVFKNAANTLPIEVKWRKDIKNLKSLDALVSKWNISESLVVTKDFEMTYENGRLSVPLWFFLLVF